MDDYIDAQGILDIDSINKDVVDHICSLKSTPSKQSALGEIFEFWNYLTSSGFLPRNPLETLDREVPQSEEARRLKLLKAIQAEPKSKEDLREVLWVSERMIEYDLEDLHMGKGILPININVTSRDNKVFYSCSVHPVALAFNLTALVELMLSIKRATETDNMYNKPLELISQQIWSQLTPYARKKVQSVLGSFPATEEKPEKFFVDVHKYIQDNILGSLIYSLKTGSQLMIRYKQNGELIYKHVKYLFSPLQFAKE